MKRLGLWVWLGVAGLALAAPAPYAAKPAWWDAVRVTVVRAASVEETVRRTEELPENRAGEEKITAGWQVLGPFDERGGERLDEPMPGEDLDFRRTWTGKGGASVRWQPWLPAEGKPIPPGANSFSALFFTEFPGTRGARRFLVVAHDDGAVVRLNGATVYKCFEWKNDPGIVPVVLEARNRLLVRLNQGGGPWNLQVSVLSEHPLWKTAKLQSEAARLFMDADPAGCVPVAERIAGAYARLADSENALHWYRFAISNQPDAEAALRTFNDASWRLGRAGDEGMITFCRALAGDAKTAPQVRRAACLQFAERMGNAGRSGEALPFLAAHESELRPLLGPRWALCVARLHILAGDWRKAEEETQKLSADGQDREFKESLESIRRLIEDNQKSLLQLPRDSDAEQVLRDVALLAREKQDGKVVETIRAVLKEKGGLFVETDDPALFRGAGLRYREGFSPYAGLYENETRQYAALLAGGPGVRGADAALPLSLQMPVPTPAPVSLPALAGIEPLVRQAPGRGFSPRLFLPPGDLDLGMAELAAAGGGAAPAGICRLPSGAVMVQNSRQLCRVEASGNVGWRRGFGNSSPVPDRSVRVLGDGFAPKTDGRRVFARLLENGRFSMYAFSAEDGVCLWRWNGGDAAACSDAVLHDGSILFLAARLDGVPRYYLVSADAATGETEFEILLCSATPEIGLSNLGPVRMDLFMPEPAVRNGMAFVNTNLGAVVAVNLRWRCLQWARTYLRAPFAINTSLTQLALRRRSCPPVVGAENVLFAPRDGTLLLLVDQRTGKLVRELPLATWSDCRAAGAASAFLVQADGDGRFLALKDLAVTGSVDGRITAVTDGFRDGVLLVRNGALEAWPADGRRPLAATLLPPGFVPLDLNASACWGFLAGASAPVLGVAAETPGDGDPGRLTAAVEPQTGRLTNPLVVRSAADTFVLSDESVSRFDGAMQPVWTCPVRGERPWLLPGANTVYLVSRGGIHMLDRATGRWLRRFPAANSEWQDLIQVRLAGDELLAAIRRPNEWQWLDIVRISRDGVKPAGRIVPSDIRGVFASGDVLAWKDGKMRIFRLAPAAGAYAEIAAVPTARPQWEIAVHRAEPDAFVVIDDRKVTLAKGGAMSPVDYHQWGGAGGGGSEEWRAGLRDGRKRCEALELVPLQFWNKRMTLLDCRTGRDIAAAAPFLPVPSFLSPARFTGPLVEPVGAKPAACTLGLYDAAAGRLLYRKPVPLQSMVEEWARPEYDFSFLLDDGSTLVHLFRTGYAESLRPAVAVVDDMKPDGAPGLRLFPAYWNCGGAAAAGGRVLMVMDARLLMFSRDEFLDLLAGRGALTPPVTTLDPAPATANAVVVDGFADEWPAETFVKARSGEYALRWSPGGVLHAAVKITDPAAVRLLARHGAEGRLVFRLVHAPYAAFRAESVAEQGVQLVLGRKNDGCEFSYAVSPDGAAVTAEVKVPLQKAAKTDVLRWKDVPWRDRRGDLAFDFQVCNEGEPPLSLLGTGTSRAALPFQYPRILLRFK